ncbi:Glutathionyl-hydroquinone reductase YqjG [Lamellibrachia satsuma]|nr:Glutathionyl-hydroquinone reductase YqjG [Lamellibrachia satsuma]
MLSSLHRVVVLVQTKRLSSEVVNVLLCGGRNVVTSGDNGRRHYAAQPKLSKKASPIASTGFNGHVAENTEFKPEAGRYHMYVALGCPWAHRTLIMRKLKGLEAAISVNVVDWVLTPDGWKFNEKKPECTQDTVNGTEGMADIYKMAEPDYTGAFTVPVLWDKQLATIVNNSSKDIMHMLNSSFNAFCATPEQRDLDFYPEQLREEIDELTGDIQPDLSQGVYKATRAITQATYQRAVGKVFAQLDKVDGILSEKRYLTGDQLTTIDIGLYTTLIRFDKVYNALFWCNKKRVVDYQYLWPYLRELYQMPALRETTNFDHITHFYYESPKFNKTGLVAVGPDIDFDQPHGRD